MTLEEAVAKIKPLDHNAMEIAQKRWDSIANHCILLENWRLF